MRPMSVPVQAAPTSDRLTHEIEDLFVCIGAQKAGTTWLARILSMHPDMFMTPVKELHYFDHIQGLTQHLSQRKLASRQRKFFQRLLTQWHRFPELRRQWSWYRTYMSGAIGDDWYASLFRDRLGRRFAGEATPEYAIIGVEGFRHLQRLAPQVRLLFILRNPVSRAWSQILHHCRTTGRDASQLDADALMDVFDEAPNSAALSDYAATLDALAQVFPASQVLLLFYEDMHEDRMASLKAVCRHIGLGFDPGAFPELGRRFNRSQEVALPDDVRVRLRERLAPQATAVLRHTGRLPERWRREFGG